VAPSSRGRAIVGVRRGNGTQEESPCTHPTAPVPANQSPELDRHALNVAFGELGLCWHWDEQTWSELQAIPTEGERLRAYVRTRHGHLLKAYDVDFLVDAIRATKSRCADAGYR
jgi:hypothetical protein